MYKSKIKSLKSDEEDLQQERQRYFAEEISWAGEDFQKITCDNSDYINDQVTIDMQLYDHDTNLKTITQVLSTNKCTKKCIVIVPRKAMCSNMNTEIEYNVSLTFWLYLIIRVFIGLYKFQRFDFFLKIV